MKIGIIGLGWYGTELAKVLHPKHVVRGTKSTREVVKSYANFPFEVFFLNLNKSIDYQALKPVFDVDALVVNIPPSRKSDDGVGEYISQMKKIIAGIEMVDSAKKIIFISSTGVFRESQVVADEDTNPSPSRKTGKILYEAEKLFTESFGEKVKIIRPGGLISGERHPAKYLAGRSGLSGANHPVNLIHRDDLVALTKVLLENDFARSVYHAVASEHPTRREYYRYAAGKLGLELPEFDENDRSRGKLVSGEKTEAVCGLQFNLRGEFH